MLISTLHLASKSDALVKLHVNDDCNMVVDIPVKNLIKINSGEESFTSTASYSNLHHCGLSAFVPNHASSSHSLKKYELVTYYQNDERNIKFSTDCELTEILEEAITNRLMDDNDGVILHIFCKYLYHSHLNDEAKKIRAAATAAADNAMRKMKFWVNNANRSLNKHVFPSSKIHKDYGPEYDVMADVSDDKTAPKALEWANRLAYFFIEPEKIVRSHNGPQKMKKRMAQIDSVENTIDILLQGVMKTSVFVSSGAMAASEFISSVIAEHSESTQEHVKTPITITSPDPSLDENSIDSSKSMSTQGEEKGVEIIFDKKSTAGPSEWAIFFDLHSSESISMGSSEDGQLISLPDGVLSCSSNDNHSSESDESNVSSLLAISEVDSDDLSWIPDSCQSCESNGNQSNQTKESLISAFSVVDNDDASWDVLEDDE